VPGDKRLVAYVIPEPATHLEPEQLRAYVSTSLANYMIPSAFVQLAAFPLTPNGKLDRGALPAPDLSAMITHEFEAPQSELERQLAAIWQDLLQVERVGRQDNFFELGGHSLLVIKLCALFAKRVGKTLMVATVFATASLAALAASVEGEVEGSGDDTAQMQRDQHLAPMNFISTPEVDFDAVLLTGASGFLGIHLLVEIQQQFPLAHVYCLVRTHAGLQRLRQAAKRYHLHMDETRLQLLHGDLNQPRLGLDLTQWQDLEQKIDVIYHCGAWVNHLHHYTALREANVQSTRELLGLCCQGRAKQMFYISTLSAALQEGNVVRENRLASSSPLDNGYVQTKWVSEHLMMQAFAAGLQGAVYRMGNITGSTQYGCSNVETNHLLSLVKGCLQQGVAPNWRDFQLDISPVDTLAYLVVSASRNQHCLNRAFNLAHLMTISWDSLLMSIARKGHALRFVAPDIWAQEWVTKMGSDNALYPFKSFYLVPHEYTPYEDVEKVLVDDEGMAFDLTQLLETYYQYWLQSGFLPAPDKTLLQEGNTTVNLH
jgi:thioester reductase-like protein